MQYDMESGRLFFPFLPQLFFFGRSKKICEFVDFIEQKVSDRNK